MSLAGEMRRMTSAWRIMRFRLLEGGAHRKLVIGSRNRFNVPVRSNGCGTLEIGAGNDFGFRAAVRVGNGEILLQPRTPEARIQIGHRNAFSNNVAVVAVREITIGDACQIGDQATIYDCDFHEIDPARRIQGVGPARPVRIGNNVWLGSRVMVLKGVSIGDNTVVGAMSVVTQSLPANCVAAGIPARIVRFILPATDSQTGRQT